MIITERDRKWMHFVGISRYATVRTIQCLEGDEHTAYYQARDELNEYRDVLRGLRRERNGLRRSVRTTGSRYREAMKAFGPGTPEYREAARRLRDLEAERDRHEERVRDYEAFVAEHEAFLQTLAPSQAVQSRLDDLRRGGYLHAVSLNGVHMTYWLTQQAIEVLGLDVPALTKPSMATIEHTLAIAYYSALIRSGTRKFGTRNPVSPAVILTETQIARQARRMQDEDPDRRMLIRGTVHNLEGIGDADEQTALELADFYVAPSAEVGGGVHTPDLVTIFGPDSHGTVAVEIEKSLKSKRNLQMIMRSYRNARDRSTLVNYLVAEDAPGVLKRVTDAIAEAGLEDYVLVKTYNPREWGASLITQVR